MRRRHTREDYLGLVARLREAMPDIALSTDMIVGFPGETEEDFEETLSLVSAVRYHSMFSFKYSPRPNTLATKRLQDDVGEDEKTRRIVALQSLQRDIQAEVYAAMVGSSQRVLVDARSRRREWELSGRTSGNTVVNFEGPPVWIGRVVAVTITAANPNSLKGGGESGEGSVLRPLKSEGWKGEFEVLCSGGVLAWGCVTKNKAKGENT